MLAFSKRFSRAIGTNDHFPFVIFQFPFFHLFAESCARPNEGVIGNGALAYARASDTRR